MKTKVRKAVIPAAGLGTRFLPATKAQPKEMLPIVDTPTIQLVVEEAVAAGITDVLIVTGRDKRAIEDHFDRSPELEALLERRGRGELLERVRRISELANIHYVRQKEPLGLGHAVLCARNHVGNEPFAVLLGDDVFTGDPPCLSQLIAQHERTGGSVVAVERVAPHEVSRYGIVRPAEVPAAGGRLHPVADLVEKPPAGEAPSDLAIMGRYVLEPGVFEALECTAPGAGGEIQLTDALRAFAHRGLLYAYEYEGRRHDIGEQLGYLKASVEFGLQRPDLRAPLLDFLAAAVGGHGAAGGRAASVEYRGSRVVPKPWGREIWWAVTKAYAGKILEVRAGESLSLQYHREKMETLLVQRGRAEVTLGEEVRVAGPGDVFFVPPGTVHRVRALTDLVLLEVSTPHLDDVVRLEDRYGRTPATLPAAAAAGGGE